METAVTCMCVVGSNPGTYTLLWHRFPLIQRRRVFYVNYLICAALKTARKTLQETDLSSFNPSLKLFVRYKKVKNQFFRKKDK